MAWLFARSGDSRPPAWRPVICPLAALWRQIARPRQHRPGSPRRTRLPATPTPSGSSRILMLSPHWPIQKERSMRDSPLPETHRHLLFPACPTDCAAAAPGYAVIPVRRRHRHRCLAWPWNRWSEFAPPRLPARPMDPLDGCSAAAQRTTASHCSTAEKGWSSLRLHCCRTAAAGEKAVRVGSTFADGRAPAVGWQAG
jgi:hypothetical protein